MNNLSKQDIEDIARRAFTKFLSVETRAHILSDTHGWSAAIDSVIVDLCKREDCRSVFSGYEKPLRDLGVPDNHPFLSSGYLEEMMIYFTALAATGAFERYEEMEVYTADRSDGSHKNHEWLPAVYREVLHAIQVKGFTGVSRFPTSRIRKKQPKPTKRETENQYHQLQGLLNLGHNFTVAMAKMGYTVSDEYTEDQP